jgi:hypothetical protein
MQTRKELNVGEHGWLAKWLADDSRGPVNSAEWRARHPEYDGPYRKPGTHLDISSCGYSFGWQVFPDLYERVPREAGQ